MKIRSISGEEIKKLYERDFGEKFNSEIPPNTMIVESEFSWAVLSSFDSVAVIYWAATIEEKRGKGVAENDFNKLLELLGEKGFKRVEFVTKRKNIKPQILSLKNGFFIFAAVSGSDGMQIAFQKELTCGP